MNIIIGIFYGFISVLNPLINEFFLLKYGTMIVLSYLSLLYIIKTLRNDNKTEIKYIITLFLLSVMIIVPTSIYKVFFDSPDFDISKAIRVILLFPIVVLIILRKVDIRKYYVNLSYIFTIVALYQITNMQGQDRVTSLFSHSNFYSIYIVILSIFLIEEFLFQQNKRKKVWIILYLLLNFFIILIGTGARTSFAIIVCLLLFTISIWSRNKAKNIIGLMTFVIITLIAAMFFKDDLFSTRIFDLQYGNVYSDQEDSFSWRLQRWESGLNSWEKSSFLIKVIGSGWETTPYISDNFRGMEMHNEYLRIFIELGLIGIISYIAILYKLFKLGFKNVRKKGYLSLTLIMITVIISSFTENIFIASESFSAITLSIAVCLGIINRQVTEDKDIRREVVINGDKEQRRLY
ncbi:O-antigen ligase family protein [Paenibacillus glycanilyticus]|uniref:O-antigen ligase family protein n=1 Tax=Paenibacillus glycanilyticus TaxID=126569 RepID=UPI00203F2202|nr:O-antigen ligase family protein [Paenibacillus glycanilyticus]MCM3630340.1 O-antigen ligase family protein [Paenibacillus glycanilyticus]